MKKEFIVFVSTALILSLSACSSDKNDKAVEVETETVVEQIVDEANDETGDESVSFEEANILEFELISRDNVSYDEIICEFKVKNNGNEDVDYLTVDFGYTDENGNEICKDGRFDDCQIKKDKTALIKSYSELNGASKDDVANVNITSYEYRIADQHYTVNLQAKEVECWTNNYDPYVDFEEANILEFTLEDKGINTIENYELGVQIKNKGSVPVKKCSYYIAYYDEEANRLSKDSRFSDSFIEPEHFVSSRSFSDSDFSNLIRTYEVYQYDYRLQEADENGFNYYEVDLQTKTAKGYLYE